MQFRSEFFPKASASKINHEHSVFLIGSCFTEQIGNKLATHKFKMLQNPHGILFNPASIAQALDDYASARTYQTDDLFFHHELFGSWNFHTQFSGIDSEKVLLEMNASIQNARNFIEHSEWIIITLGSAFVYELANDGRVVANCHKVPADKFNKRLLAVAETIALLKRMILTVRNIRKHSKIIFTISPVRHLRDGFVENNRSKAVLINAVHEVVNSEDIQYFPSYELIIDDLRDYRFYAEDLMHPNYAATQYVWEKFISAYMNDTTISLMKEIASIQLAMRHKPFNPTSQQHKKFLENALSKTLEHKETHNYLVLDEEVKFFSEQLEKYHG